MVVDELYRDAADNEGARSSFTFDSAIIEKALRNILSKRINTRTTIDAGLFSEVQRIVSNAIDIGYDAPAGGSSFAQELKNKLEHIIILLKNKEQREHFDKIKIHRTEISNYTKKSGRCIITMQSSIQYYHYITDQTGRVISGSKDVLFQSKYETDLIYIQDRSLVEGDLGEADGLNCPNCGAPITSLGQKFCEYCGTGVVAYNIHVWSFSDVREC